MGLDNGIVLKIKDKEKFGGDRLPSWMPRADWEDEGNYPWEILYWRKCWNIRDVIFQHLKDNRIKTSEECEFDMPMSLEVFWNLCVKLEKCYTEKWWNEHNDSIWSWEEVDDSGNYKEQLMLACRLIGWLETKDPSSYEICFYDSY